MLCTAILAGCAGIPPHETPGAHVVLHSNLSPEHAAEIQEDADRTVKGIAGFLDLELPPTRAKVLLFRYGWSRWLYLSRECPKHSSAAAACFEKPGRGYVIALSDRWTRAETLRHLRHELAHFVIASHFYDIPPWLDEGLAQFFELGPPYGEVHPDCLKSVARQVARGRKRRLTRLVAVPVGEGLTRSEYALAWGLTWFLMTDGRFGPGRVRRYLGEVRSDQDPESQFQRHFGLAPGKMEPVWRQAILDHAAM